MALRFSNRMAGQGSIQCGPSISRASARTEASSRSVVSEAVIGRPCKVAPPPRVAVKVSPRAGAWITAATGRPSSTTAMGMHHQGLDFMKATVPSMGSTTKMRRFDRRSVVSAVSSDSQP